LKDFDICPSIVNKSFIYQLWQDIILNQSYDKKLIENLQKDVLPLNSNNDGKVFK